MLSSRWLKVGISLGLFGVLLRSVDLREFTHHILAARPELFALAFSGYVAGQGLSAYKWRLLAAPLGFEQSLRTFTVYYFIGMYLNLFAPSTVVGDLGRGLLLANNRNRLGPALQSVLADRVSGLIMLLWVSAAGFLVCGPTVLPAAVCYGTIAAALLTIVGWWSLPRLLNSLFSPHHTVRRLIEALLIPYRREAALLGWVCGVSLVFHFFQLGLQMLLARALNLALPFWYLVLFIPLVQIASALPLSFGGVGVREGGYVIFLAFIGVGRDEALAFGLLWSAVVLGANVLGGVVLLLSPQVQLSLASVRKTRDE